MCLDHFVYFTKSLKQRHMTTVGEKRDKTWRNNRPVTLLYRASPKSVTHWHWTLQLTTWNIRPYFHCDVCALRNSAGHIVYVIRYLSETGFTPVFTWLSLLQRNLYSIAICALRTWRDNLTVAIFSYGSSGNIFSDSLLRFTSFCTRKKWQPDK